MNGEVIIPINPSVVLGSIPKLISLTPLRCAPNSINQIRTVNNNGNAADLINSFLPLFFSINNSPLLMNN
ncbi:MAG: hypothetical protein IPI10_01165 [Bacteroidetes bacterium]|nr:hypothetical protein [Bacteroidota bacterium]